MGPGPARCHRCGRRGLTVMVGILPARLTAHARRRTLHLGRTRPWTAAFTTAHRLPAHT